MTTFVLVHGGWHGGWCWKKVVPLLHRVGHAVFTPTLTGLGERAHLLTPEIDLNVHIQDILAVFTYEDLYNVCLVGHSYGGMVITAVAEHVPERITQLVYLDAFVPGDGQCMFDLLDATNLAALQEQAQTVGAGWYVPPPPLTRYGVTQADDLQWMNPKVGVHPLKTFVQPVHLVNERARTLPRTYISCTIAQRPVFAATAERIRTKSDWQYYELATEHDAMVTAPDELTKLLVETAVSSADRLRLRRKSRV